MSDPPENPGAPSPMPPVGCGVSGAESGSVPAPRRFSAQTLKEWIAEDEADFVRLSTDAGDP